MGQKFPSSAMDRRSRFPSGHYAGTISESKDDTNEDGTAGSVSFRLINNVAVDADKEPGGRICFIRVATFMEVKDKRGKVQTLLTSDVEDTEDENIPFQLRLAVGTFMMLAVALGRAVNEAGEVEFDDSLESFIDELRDGKFDGVELEFIVAHRQYIAKRGPNKGNVVKVEDVTFPEIEEEEGEGGGTEPEPEPEPEPKDKPRLRKGAKASARAEAKKDDEDGDGGDGGEEQKGSGRPKFVRRSRKATK